MIRQYGVPGDIQVLSRFDADSSIKAHASYVQAKAGDPKAALDLISDLALAWLLGVKDRFSLSCTFVAPHAKEVSGDKFHTGADPMERMATRAEFEGDVVAGERYVLVDDVISMGGTLARQNSAFA